MYIKKKYIKRNNLYLIYKENQSLIYTKETIFKEVNFLKVIISDNKHSNNQKIN